MTKTQPTHKKLPAARVGYALPESYDQSGKVIHGWPKHHKGYIPLAVIPCHTPAQAKSICRAAPFLRMTEGERVNLLHAAIADDPDYQSIAHHQWLDLVNTVLRAMNLGDSRK